MAINPNLLVAAPMLQDYLVDKDTGQALSNGIITLYQDTSRTTFKNWYYQSGSPGNYTYITLPNPLTLSAVGTIQDNNGNDTIPFYYPFSETDNQTPQTYYIVVTDQNGEIQFTRQNFPFIGTESPVTNKIPTLDNYIINNVFWRNIGSANVSTPTNTITINSSTNYFTKIAPDQHDGFSMSDIIFIKNNTTATDAITFTKFSLGDPSGQVLVNDITPEYYVNFTCSVAGSAETLKCIQIPISLHVKTLESVQASVVVHAQNVGASANNTLQLAIYQFLGTGVTSGSPIVIQTLTLTDNWTKYVINFTFPSAAGLTLGNGGDDALYLQLGFPLSSTCNINIAKPQIYLSQTVPNNSFETYDQVNTIISSARTGDTRSAINSHYPFGWVPMNDGTIGNSSSNGTGRSNQDVWRLFNLIWDISKPYDSGSNFNPISTMYTSAGSATNFGSSAISDFNANNSIQLTRRMGRVLVGTVPISALLAATPTTPANLAGGYTSVVTFSNSGGNILVTAASSNLFNLFTGMTITFQGGVIPSTIGFNDVYYIVPVSTTTFNISTTFANALAGTIIAWGINVPSGTTTGYLATTGSSEGEYGHVQLESQLAAHNHPGSTITGTIQNYCGAGGSSTYNTTALPTSANVQIATDGSSAQFNVTQPGTFYNVFIKL